MGEVYRLSLTPDGQTLVLQCKMAVQLVALASKTKREFKPLALKDTEVQTGVKELEDACAGPGNDEVTFSGLTIDAKGVRRRRIYVAG